MSQQTEVKFSQPRRSSRQNEPSQQSIKDIIAMVDEKKRHYKKVLSQMDSSLKQSNLKYLFDGSNSISAVTSQQKEFLKEQHLARGSIPEFQLQTIQHRNRKKLRFKYEKIKNHRSLKKKQMEDIAQMPALKRYKTIANEQMSSQLKPSFLYSPTRQLSHASKPERALNKLRISVAQIRRSGKSTQKLQRVYSILAQFNPFFAKIERAVGVCLLRVGYIQEMSPNQVLYDMRVSSNRFYIILEGQVKLKGPQGMRKICSTGETLLEQILLTPKSNMSLQKAKAASESIILEIETRDYDKLTQELYRLGFKQGAQQLNSLIRRNFIVKNWLRNKFKHIYNN